MSDPGTTILPLPRRPPAGEITAPHLSATEAQALAALRRMIIDGRLDAGAKISEVTAAGLTGLSRTPVRAALVRLEGEGLIAKRAGRGYTVREITDDDIRKAIQVRGALEGLAAACMAENGADAETRRAITGSIAATEAAVSAGTITEDAVSRYQDANIVFHDTLITRCGNDLVGRSYDRVRHVPTIRPGTFALNADRLRQERIRMTTGHSHHVLVWDAIQAGEAIRADMLMREHAFAPLNYARLFVGDAGQAGQRHALRSI